MHDPDVEIVTDAPVSNERKGPQFSRSVKSSTTRGLPAAKSKIEVVVSTRETSGSSSDVPGSKRIIKPEGRRCARSGGSLSMSDVHDKRLSFASAKANGVPSEKGSECRQTEKDPSKRQSARLRQKRPHPRVTDATGDRSMMDRRRRERGKTRSGKDDYDSRVTIVVDEESEAQESIVASAEDEENAPPGRIITTRSRTRREASSRGPSVPLDHEEAAAGRKELSSMDAPYQGPTHLIFEYPPGQRGKISVTAEERCRLAERKYLNDTLIDFYIKYQETELQNRTESLRFSAKFFSSFFFGRLRRSGAIDYQGVKKWTKDVDLFAKRYVFVPICDSYHWSLIIVANLNMLEDVLESESRGTGSNSPRIIYLDSLDPKRGTEFGKTIRRYLVEEWLTRKKKVQPNSFTHKETASLFEAALPIFKPNVPIQTNEYDCGLYLLKTLKMFLANTDGMMDRLLAGTRDMRNVYSHVEIHMLRKDIIGLMDNFEEDWKRNSTRHRVEKVAEPGFPNEHARASAPDEEAIESPGDHISGAANTSAPSIEAGSASDDRNAPLLVNWAAINDERSNVKPQPSNEDMADVVKSGSDGYEKEKSGIEVPVMMEVDEYYGRQERKPHLHSVADEGGRNDSPERGNVNAVTQYTGKEDTPLEGVRRLDDLGRTAVKFGAEENPMTGLFYGEETGVNDRGNETGGRMGRDIAMGINEGADGDVNKGVAAREVTTGDGGYGRNRMAKAANVDHTESYVRLHQDVAEEECTRPPGTMDEKREIDSRYRHGSIVKKRPSEASSSSGVEVGIEVYSGDEDDGADMSEDDGADRIDVQRPDAQSETLDGNRNEYDGDSFMDSPNLPQSTEDPVSIGFHDNTVYGGQEATNIR